MSIIINNKVVTIIPQVIIKLSKNIAENDIINSGLKEKNFEETQSATPEKAEDKVLDIPDNGVFIEVLKETWVEVKDESKLYLSKVLQKGDTYTVPEGKGMILSFGKYDGANVYINGVLTTVARPNKKTNIELDPLLEANRQLKEFTENSRGFFELTAIFLYK